MKKNMGSKDKLIRLIAALAIVVLYYTDLISGTLAVILCIVAAIFAITSFINFCPIYSIFGFRTNKKTEK